jgi:hypothetical protein
MAMVKAALRRVAADMWDGLRYGMPRIWDDACRGFDAIWYG